MKSIISYAIVACAVSTPAYSQNVVMEQSAETVLRTGTPVALRIIEGVTTKDKTAKINDRVRMEIAEAVTLNNVVVIPAGSPAVGELTDVRYKGMWGKSGRIVGRVLTVNVNGRTIRLSGTFDSKGGSGTAGAVAVSALVFLPAGFFMTGKSAEFPAGSVVRGFIDEDINVKISPSAAPNSEPLIIK